MPMHVTDADSRPKIFLLSPARVDGQRARTLLSPSAAFPLAVQLRRREGAALGDVFAFLSGLYFRGKLIYSFAFVTPDAAAMPIRIITTNRGLLAPDHRVRPRDLRSFGDVDLSKGGQAFERPLLRDARSLNREAPDALVVLLGSIATGKYVEPLGRVFGQRLVFPAAFVGRGDMSRGGLMLRCARAGTELEYVPVLGAVRHGVRPPKLPPIRRVGDTGR